MKRMISMVLLFCLVFVATVFCIGAEVVPVATPAAAPAVPIFQQVINWMQLNAAVTGMLIAAIIDFILAINPAWQSNGAIHGIYLFAMKLAGKPVTSTPPS